MNCYSAKDLADSFRTVRKNTLIIAQDLPEEKYTFRPAPDTRSPGELLAHIALAHDFQYQIHATERRTTLAGFDFPAIMKRLAAEEKEPRTKDQIIEMLRSSGEKWAGWLQGLSDDFLAEQVQMAPGMTSPAKCRFEMILSEAALGRRGHARGHLHLFGEEIVEQVQMAPGMTSPAKCRFEMILSVKEHEMHHRGQLMLIERLLGIVPQMTREMQSRLAAAVAKR